MAGSEAFLTTAYNKVMWGAAVDWPGDAAFRLYGLDLWDCPWRRSEGRVCYDRQGLVSRVPACPGMPPRPPAAWATWAPAWSELPLPEKIPRDFWYVPEQADRDLFGTLFGTLLAPSFGPRGSALFGTLPPARAWTTQRRSACSGTSPRCALASPACTKWRAPGENLLQQRIAPA